MKVQRIYLENSKKKEHNDNQNRKIQVSKIKNSVSRFKSRLETKVYKTSELNDKSIQIYKIKHIKIIIKKMSGDMLQRSNIQGLTIKYTTLLQRCC